MGEPKLLNRYYPPELPKDRQHVVRVMAPFSMWCTTCGEYIYVGKRFNARKETVWDQEYLGIRIYRFYIRCTRCISEIIIKTDPQNTDYVCENGAVRNFQAERFAIMAAEESEKLKENEEAENPMLALDTNGVRKKRSLESELLPEEKRCYVEEVKLKSEEISRKSYKSKLQSFVIKKPVTRAEIPADSTPKGLLKLGDYISDTESD